MIKPDAIIKSNRRSISITITKSGEVVVYAPKRISADRILNFLSDKETWIKKKQTEILDNLNKNKNILEYKSFLFLGKTYIKYEVSKLKKIELTNSCLLCPKDIEEKKQLYKIAKWYFESARIILKDRLEYFATLMQLDYMNISICNTKNKWGSCDSNGNIKFNFRMIMLPHKIIDYIIIHELSHLVELNHSKNFYKIISSVMSDYEIHRKNLKNYTFILQLFR